MRSVGGMVANPAPGSPTCKHCGCYLACDDRDPVCSPCRRSYADRRGDGYRPQHDHALRAAVLCTLMEHEGERINIYQAMGMWPAGVEEWWAVYNVVKWLRRHGHKVVGHRNTGEYEYHADGRG